MSYPHDGNPENSESIRPELAELIERTALGLDENRPEAVARRQKKNQRTTRTNVEDFCDSDSFIEYGGLAIAAQRMRRSEEELRVKTPADGLIAGIGSVNGDLFALVGIQYADDREIDRLAPIDAKHKTPFIGLGRR